MAVRERELRLEDLATVRTRTEAVATAVAPRLEAHVQTLAPLLAPARLLGPHLGSDRDERVPGADRAFETLRERYRAHTGLPLSMPRELDDELRLSSELELHPWEYVRSLGDDGADVVVTDPFRWTLAYRGGYQANELRRALAPGEAVRRDDVQRFAVGCLALQLLLEAHSGIEALLSAMQFELVFEPYDGLGELPVASLRADLPTYLPGAALIRTATQVSGVSAFIELFDIEAFAERQSPLDAHIRALLDR